MIPNSYTIIHLSKDNYKDYLPLGEIAAYMYDDTSKEKEQGNLSIMTADLCLYILDYKQDDFSWVELYELCPPLSANKWSNQTKWKITFWEYKKFCINANIASLFYSYGWVNQRKDEYRLYSNWGQWVAEILNNPKHRERVMDAKRAVERFILIHQEYYVEARNEIRNNRKIFHKDVSQWIFGIFPQPIGLCYSRMSTYNGIESCAEAKAFLDNPYLGKNLREITKTLLTLDRQNIRDIFVEIDAMKVRSSMTLFDLVCPNDIFAQVLDKYYDGKRCELTIERIKRENNK
jgi:uncharacterized protein (DUF1810 family)